MLPPFTAPLAPVTDHDAWRGGKHRAPTWRRDGRLLDAPSVHMLVRAANLPRAELLHMGWTHELLSPSASEWLCARTVAPLLGRIVSDAAYDRDEGSLLVWIGDQHDKQRALNDGLQVIGAWFHA